MRRRLLALYNGTASPADLDRGIHDPWSREFSDLFNDCSYEPAQPRPHNGVTDSLLMSLNPRHHPHERSATFLKNKWATMRSSYSVAKKTLKPRDRGLMTFLTNSLTAIQFSPTCIVCFFGLPCLEAIVREIPHPFPGRKRPRRSARCSTYKFKEGQKNPEQKNSSWP